MTYLPPFGAGHINASIGGNSTSAGAGYALVSSGTMLLAGGNNVTLSQNGNTVTISAGAGGAGASNTFGMSNLSNTSGTTGVISGSALQFALAGGNNVTLSQSINASSATITVSAANQTAQTQSNIQAIYDGANSISTGTIRLTNANGVSFSVNGQTLSASVAAQSAQPVALSGSNGSFNYSTATFGNLNGMSFYTSNGSMVGSYTVPSQTVQTQNMHDLQIAGNTTGTSALVSSGTLSLAGGNNITLSQTTSAGSYGITISAASQTVQTQNLHDLQIIGNTTGTSALISSGTLNLAGGNNITLSAATAVGGNTITISAASQTNQTLSLSAVGNTTGATNAITQDARSLTFNGLGGVSVGYSNGSIEISGGAGGGGGVAIAASNTTFNTGTVVMSNNGGALTISSGAQSVLFSVPATSSLSATGALSVSTNGSTISLGVSNPAMSFYQNLGPANSVQPHAPLAIAYNTLILQPLSPMEGYGFPGDMSVSTLMMQMSGTATATSISSSYSSVVMVGLYLLANSTEISLVNSASSGWSAAANTNITTAWMGARFLTVHSSLWSSTPMLSFNARYWFGILHLSTNLGTNAGAQWMGQYLAASTQRSGTWGVSQNTNTSMGHIPFLGVYNTSLTSLPATIGNSQVNKVNVSAGFMPGLILNATFSAY